MSYFLANTEENEIKQLLTEIKNEALSLKTTSQLKDIKELFDGVANSVNLTVEKLQSVSETEED